MADDDIEVKYGLKEILSRMEKAQWEGFARVEKAMENKADKSDVARIETTLRDHATRLDGHDEQFRRLDKRMGEDEAAQRVVDRASKSRLDGRHWMIETALTVLLIFATVLLVWHP